MRMPTAQKSCVGMASHAHGKTPEGGRFAAPLAHSPACCLPESPLCCSPEGLVQRAGVVKRLLLTLVAVGAAFAAAPALAQAAPCVLPTTKPLWIDYGAPHV